MKNWLIAALSFLVIAIECGAVNALQHADFLAVFKPNVLEFSFPVQKKTTYEWYQAKTPDNDLEYAWQIRLEGTKNRSNCEFGVYLYKYPSSRPQNGDFKKLISSSQVSVWNRNGSLNTNMKITALVENNRLIVRVTDKNTIRFLTANHPEFIFFTVRSPDNFTTRKIPVHKE